MWSIITSMLASKGLDAIGNLVEGGADKAIDLIAEKTGIKLDGVKELTPEQEQALREYDIQLRTINLESEKAFLSDRNSSRDMQKTALQQDDLFSKRFVYYLATAWSLFSFIYIGCITFLAIPPANLRFADTILGFILGTVIATIIYYFFGTSASSHHKTNLLANKD